MTSARLLILLLALAASGCSVFRRHKAEPPPAPVVAAPVPAQPVAAPTPPTAARDLADAMTTVLHLRPDQTTKVRQILNATVTQANAAQQQYPAQSAQLTAALRRINAASDTQLRQVLGPATYKALQTKQAQVQAQMQQR
ncbi:MAG: hypothetical protein ACRYFX_04980 [Janthinobacterium lividum]